MGGRTWGGRRVGFLAYASRAVCSSSGGTEWWERPAGGGWDSCGTCWECVRDFYLPAAVAWLSIHLPPKIYLPQKYPPRDKYACVFKKQMENVMIICLANAVQSGPKWAMICGPFFHCPSAHFHSPSQTKKTETLRIRPVALLIAEHQYSVSQPQTPLLIPHSLSVAHIFQLSKLADVQNLHICCSVSSSCVGFSSFSSLHPVLGLLSPCLLSRPSLGRAKCQRLCWHFSFTHCWLAFVYHFDLAQFVTGRLSSYGLLVGFVCLFAQPAYGHQQVPGSPGRL